MVKGGFEFRRAHFVCSTRVVKNIQVNDNMIFGFGSREMCASRGMGWRGGAGKIRLLKHVILYRYTQIPEHISFSSVYNVSIRLNYGTGHYICITPSIVV